MLRSQKPKVIFPSKLWFSAKLAGLSIPGPLVTGRRIFLTSDLIAGVEAGRSRRIKPAGVKPKLYAGFNDLDRAEFC